MVSVAAIAATLTVARQRSEARPIAGPEPGRAPAAPLPDLDALRSAGL